MKHIYFICNLQAGKTELTPYLGLVIDMMTKAGYEVTVRPTQAPLDAASAATEAADSGRFDYIFCAGGDGTLNEVMDGLMKASRKVPLGYIPCGSVNDFARSIGIPFDIPKAVGAVLNGTPRYFDMGTANGRSFNYIAAFGAFTDVTYDTPQAVKNVFGQAAYIFNALTKIPNIRPIPYRIICDGQAYTDDFIYGMITNTASVGGLLDISDFQFDDGLFEITLIKRPENPIELHDTIRFLRDIHEIGEEDRVICLKASDIVVEQLDESDVPWTVDGEYLKHASELHIVNHKRAVALLVPRESDAAVFQVQ